MRQSRLHLCNNLKAMIPARNNPLRTSLHYLNNTMTLLIRLQMYMYSNYHKMKILNLIWTTWDEMTTYQLGVIFLFPVVNQADSHCIKL